MSSCQFCCSSSTLFWVRTRRWKPLKPIKLLHFCTTSRLDNTCYTATPPYIGHHIVGHSTFKAAGISGTTSSGITNFLKADHGPSNVPPSPPPPPHPSRGLPLRPDRRCVFRRRQQLACRARPAGAAHLRLARAHVPGPRLRATRRRFQPGDRLQRSLLDGRPDGGGALGAVLLQPEQSRFDTKLHDKETQGSHGGWVHGKWV